MESESSHTTRIKHYTLDPGPKKVVFFGAVFVLTILSCLTTFLYFTILYNKIHALSFTSIQTFLLSTMSFVSLS